MISPLKMALFISGKGSNALNIVRYFEKHTSIEVSLIVSSKGHLEMEQMCQEKGILFVDSTGMYETALLMVLQAQGIHFVVLAGYLKLIGSEMIEAFPNRILNIHPALLPKFGGKGMYGMRVHQAVVDAHEPISGITIHLVNAVYDEGEILAQFSCLVSPSENSLDLEKKVRALEHKHYPEVIETYATSLLKEIDLKSPTNRS